MTREKTEDERQDDDDEEFLRHRIEGRAGGDLKFAKIAQEVCEKRVEACIRVAGMTLAAVATQDRTLYRRFLRGCRRAVVRASLVHTGQLTGFDVHQLSENFQDQRRLNRIAEEYPIADEDRRYP